MNSSGGPRRATGSRRALAEPLPAADQATSRSIYEGGWRIDLTVRPGVPRLLAGAVLARTAARALAAAGAPARAALGVILSSDAELAALNETHMGDHGATDVLSFPLLPPKAFPGHEGKSAVATPGPSFVLPPSSRVHLGDLVVSVERAIAQADAGRGGQTGDMRWSAVDELRLLVTHGVLHVSGWDHADPIEERAMRALERQLLQRQ